ncbi:MAG: hypothetical protein Q8939_06595 [Bacteroidota bacterium]|nr:hypothetical protein [Bacteroidota bacterium]
MKAHFSKEEQAVIGAVRYQPEVSIIMPFEPGMSVKKELQHQLKIAVEKVESQLFANYPSKKAMPVVVRLKNLIRKLDFNTRKKGLAIFVSPIIEKVFYLDIPVNEKIIIGESFEIRDIVYCKKQLIQYLVLQLSGESSKIYLGNCSTFIPIKSTVPQNVHAYERDMPEKVGNFSDQDKHKEVLLDNFLHHLDQGLTEILKEYPLPVFVMGPERVLGHFKKITKNEKSLVQFIQGNYLEASETEIREVMESYLKNWREIKERASLLQLEQARSENKLEFGIKQVWKIATHENSRLLLVEKDFMYPAHQGSDPDSIYKEDLSLDNPFYIKDAVDEIMEKVLAAGGDIEFVSNEALKEYGHIALIRYY